MRKVALVLAALLALTLVAAGPAAATHDNPNWGEDAGDNDCTTGHINPHDDGVNYAGPDDCGLSNGNVPSHAGHPVP